METLRAGFTTETLPPPHCLRIIEVRLNSIGYYR